MKALQVLDNGALVWGEVPEPDVGPEEVKIQIFAFGINRADLLQKRGKYPPPPDASPILGLECAGIITEVGEKVTEWSVGQAVCALLAGGGYAEFASVHQGLVFPIPEGYSFEEAAALPEALCTAVLNLIFEGKMRAKEVVLIHSAAGGVGTIALQVAKFRKAIPIAVAGSDEKLMLCSKLGASICINYRTEDFVQRIRQIYGAVDVILDTVGGKYFAQHLQILGYRGRLILIGLLGGATAEIALNTVLFKNIRIVGSTLRNRSIKEKSKLCRYIRKHLWKAVSERVIVPVLDSVFDYTQIAAAHERMEKNLNIGKIVVRMRD